MEVDITYISMYTLCVYKYVYIFNRNVYTPQRHKDMKSMKNGRNSLQMTNRGR